MPETKCVSLSPNCSIISGATSRLKRVRIDTQQSFDEVLAALGVERQMRLF